MKDEKDRVIKFLKANDWKIDVDQYSPDEEYWTYINGENIAVSISDKEMVFLGGSGDFLHEKINLYTLIGVLVYHRQLPLNFKQS